MSEQGLSVSEVCQTFRNENGTHTEALDNICLTIRPGEIVSLLGPSGSGKSSLLNIIAGFDAPVSGEVRLDGERITGPSAQRCVVFQTPALFEWLTARENVTFGLKRRRVPPARRREEAGEMLRLVGLDGFEDSYPHELSGGMQQRVALARAFVLHPRLLLMDEPFAALDAQLRYLMQSLLLKLWKKRGQTILFVTHDVEEAVRISHRIVIFERRPGRIREELTVPFPMERRGELLGEPGFQALREQIQRLMFTL